MITAGTRAYRADLHIHTPGSEDFRDRSATAEDIVERCTQSGLQIVAVTDHNSVAWVERIREAAAGTSLTVIPGVEITTPQGHVLALFEKDTPETAVADLLVQVGIDRQSFGKKEAVSRDSIEDVVKKIDSCGGLAIAAHANTKRLGALQAMSGQAKIRFVAAKKLAALELTKEDEIERFSCGTVSQDYDPKACVQGSDAHSLEEIGDRVCYMRMDEPSLRGIRQALLDYQVRVRFPWNIVTTAHPRINRLEVNQGFFGGKSFEFHEGLNCLVGGTGTGKSTVIEMLRYCFDDVASFPSIRKDHDGKMSALVGEGATIAVHYFDRDGEEKIIRREVQLWETAREVRDATGNLSELLSKPRFFSQGEVLQIAAAPLAQLDLLDRHLDLTSYAEQEADTIAALRKNARLLSSVRERIRRSKAELEHPENGKRITHEQYSRLDAQLKEPVLKEFPLWREEQEYLEELLKIVEGVPAAYEAALEEATVTDGPAELNSASPNKEVLEGLDVGKHLEAVKEKLIEDLRAQVEKIKHEVVETQERLKEAYEEKKKEYDTVVEGIGEDVRKANARFQSLSRRRKALEKCESELATAQEEFKDAKAEREELRSELSSVRNRRWKERQQQAEKYESELGGILRINVIEAGDRVEYAEQLRQLAKGGNINFSDIKRVARLVHPSDLVRLISSNNEADMAKRAEITEEVARRIIRNVRAKNADGIYEIEVVKLPDVPDIRYVLGDGRERSLEELSTGQKGVVIIALAMAEGNAPLVVDHPEEPLDTQSIFSHVVKRLRELKETRQFVFTTHNPNVAVGADADLNQVLEASAEKGEIVARGGVDQPEINRLLLIHLEGGPEALELRMRKYQIDD